MLYPHGLGKKAKGDATISYGPDALTIGGTMYEAKGTLAQHPNFELRTLDAPADGGTPSIVEDILKRCPAKILGVFRQVFSHHAGSNA